MILTCPACETSYSVKDGAIPAHGRTVRCAACKHSWHEEGAAALPLAEPTVPAPIMPPEPLAGTDQPAAPEPAVEQADAHPVPTQTAAPVETGVVEAVDDNAAAPVAAGPPPAQTDAYVDWNDTSYGDDDEPASRRKGPMIIGLLILLVAALAAAAWFLAPREWMSRVGLVAPSDDSPLKLMVTSQDRQKLASGNDLVSLSGRVINPTDSTQPVPALQADLRDSGGKLVYSWTIAPPAERLAPRASASFNAAELGVPANATSLTLRWAS